MSLWRQRCLTRRWTRRLGEPRDRWFYRIASKGLKRLALFEGPTHEAFDQGTVDYVHPAMPLEMVPMAPDARDAMNRAMFTMPVAGGRVAYHGDGLAMLRESEAETHPQAEDEGT